MSNYRLYINVSAQKELDALQDVLFERIKKKIEALAAMPRPSGVKKLKGYKNYWRIRIGDYRVIYAIDDALAQIDVVRVAHRREVYQ